MNDNTTNQEVTQTTTETAANSPVESAFDTPEEKEFSFESVIYGENETKRGTPLEEPTQQPEAPKASAPTEGLPEQPYEAKNDEKRFEYWQSRASKLENKIKEQENIVNMVQQNPQVQQAPVEQAPEEFPPPPERPGRPHNYNREASFTDPNSESARYDIEVENWRDQMDEYNSLKVQYETAVVKEQMDEMRNQQSRQVQNAQRKAAQTERMSEVNDYVQAEYGLTPEESKQFMQDMSSPKSVNMGNLVTLWRMNNGKSAAPPVETPGLQMEAPTQNVGQPSDVFQQTRIAQQVPSPMGVQSGQASSNPDDGMTEGEKFMTALINNNNDKQVF